MTTDIEQLLVATLERSIAALEKIERRMADNDSPTLTLEQACERLHCKRRKFFMLIQQGKLRRVREGKETCVTAESVDAFLGLASRR
jgi:excisionase family DNA binding protein